MKMVECDFCRFADSEFVVFEDAKVVAVLTQSPANPGHVIVVPREHFTILEQVPDFVAGHLFAVANRISTAMFEVLRSTGTNIIVENGVCAGQKIPHLGINIIPRMENDGLGFAWPPLKLSEDDFSNAEFQLKEAAKNIGGFEKEKPTTINADKKTELLSPDEDDYLVRQLRRIP